MGKDLETSEHFQQGSHWVLTHSAGDSVPYSVELEFGFMFLRSWVGFVIVLPEKCVQSAAAEKRGAALENNIGTKGRGCCPFTPGVNFAKRRKTEGQGKGYSNAPVCRSQQSGGRLGKTCPCP